MNGKSAGADPGARAAGLVITCAAIHTMDLRRPSAGARQVELGEGTLLPRFIDAKAPGRPRLEHVVFATRAQARRIANLGAVAVVQPGFIRETGDDLLLTPLPPPIETMPLRSLAEAGVELAGSSDTRSPSQSPARYECSPHPVARPEARPSPPSRLST